MKETFICHSLVIQASGARMKIEKRYAKIAKLFFLFFIIIQHEKKIGKE